MSIVAGTKKCNAKCPFCISKMTPNNGINNVEPEVNWRNFRQPKRKPTIFKEYGLPIFHFIFTNFPVFHYCYCLLLTLKTKR